MAEATFAAGCFWGVEETFRHTKGVTATAVGYIGGNTENPSYEQVCSGRTGHAEAVRLEFDPEQVSFEELLEVFWRAHDPSQLDRQGPDFGTQYRSAIFTDGETQHAAALASKAAADASGEFPGPIVTTIEAAPTFYMAEDYHQQYVEKRRRGGLMRG